MENNPLIHLGVGVAIQSISIITHRRTRTQPRQGKNHTWFNHYVNPSLPLESITRLVRDMCEDRGGGEKKEDLAQNGRGGGGAGRIEVLTDFLCAAFPSSHVKV